jgi:hypothetical protein
VRCSSQGELDYGTHSPHSGIHYLRVTCCVRVFEESSSISSLDPLQIVSNTTLAHSHLQLPTFPPQPQPARLAALGFPRQERCEPPQQTCRSLFRRPYYSSPLSHFFRGGLFLGSTSSAVKMDSPLIYLRVLARSIYSTVFPTGFRPLSSSSLFVLPL